MVECSFESISNPVQVQFGSSSFECLFVVGSNPVAVTLTSDIAPVLSNEFLDIEATIERDFTLKRVSDMIRAYSQGCSNETLQDSISS